MEWVDTLRDYGFAGSDVRLAAVAQFLATSGFSKLSQLQHADRPNSWPGAENLLGEELKFVAALRSTKRICRRPGVFVAGIFCRGLACVSW